MRKSHSNMKLTPRLDESLAEILLTVDASYNVKGEPANLRADHLYEHRRLEGVSVGPGTVLVVTSRPFELLHAIAGPTPASAQASERRSTPW